ncbi:MAG: cytidine deaminase [Bacilli bacterium]|nr:cytidine deaminase [Bacilli bacterium]
MKDKLLELHKNSYSPYFHYPVSAIVVMKDGSEFSGVNVENANGTSICAERNAIHNAIASGYKKGDFKEINVMTRDELPSTPCFACRQVMLEFFDKNDIVRCYGTSGEYREFTIDELCPYPFSEDDLQ